MRAIKTTGWDTLEAKALKYCLDNGGIMERWSYKVIHPKTGKVAFVVEDRILPCLTSIEIGKIIELPKEWLPKPEL